MTYQQLIWEFALETKRLLVDKFKIKNLRSFKRLLPDKCEKYQAVVTLGECDTEGHVRIGIRSPKQGKLWNSEEIVDTVCHELAHLEHHDHTSRWNRLYRKYYKYITNLYERS